MLRSMVSLLRRVLSWLKRSQTNGPSQDCCIWSLFSALLVPQSKEWMKLSLMGRKYSTVTEYFVFKGPVANELIAPQFGIGNKSSSRDSWLVGLVNSAPYLCCAFIGCWLTVPFNKKFGRRGTIFLTCTFSALACFWQAFTNTWWHMFIARFALGLGIGPKSATVPIYAAECSPPLIRGALVMQWQMWTAFGIFIGYAADLAFFKVPDRPGITGLRWRLMMGSAMLPAVTVCCFVFLCPESPRWYMSKGRHERAYRSMCRLRYNKVQAARDVFYMHTLLEAENESVILGQNKVKEMFTVPRNRRAMQASEIVMFMQQVRPLL
jgi:MFS family permease